MNSRGGFFGKVIKTEKTLAGLIKKIARTHKCKIRGDKGEIS